MVTALLEQTFEHRRNRFEPLVLEVIRCGLTYRQKNNNPVTTSEIDRINQLILDLGFKFPDLWDPGFRAALKGSSATKTALDDEQLREQRLREVEGSKRRAELD
jgi:hypothetical protein